MTAELSSASVYTDFQGLAKLKAEAGRQSPEALREAARQFEALFLNMMLKSMRDSVQRDEGGLTDSQGVRFFEGMYDQQMSLHLSQGRGMGLADVIEHQLGGQPRARDGGAASASLNMPSTRVPALTRSRIDAAMATPQAPVSVPTAAKTESAREADALFAPDSPEAFVREVWPHAARAAERLGVEPEVLVAQAALETGWGRHVMRGPDGVSSHNLFGIKADSRWGGERVTVSTLEYVGGIAERQRAAFRAYEDVGRSFDDYADFILQNPRYRGALAEAGTPEGYLRGIQRAGYATDPAYADKILSILHRGPVSEVVAELKSGAVRSIT